MSETGCQNTYPIERLMKKPSLKKPTSLPDPVIAAAGGATVKAWVDKDEWIDGAPPEGVPKRFFVNAIVQRGIGYSPIEVDVHGLSSSEIADLAAALRLAAMTTEGR